MEPFFLLVLMAALLLARGLLALLSGLGRLLSRPARCERRLPFLTAAERRCLMALEETAGEDYRVFAQVTLAALVTVAPGVGRRRATQARALLRGEIVDFVLCGRLDCHPRCVAILLPSGKPRRAARQRLERLRRFCAQAELPLLTLTEQPSYHRETLQQQLRAALARHRDTSFAGAPGVLVDDGIAPEEEDELLAKLSASLRDPNDRRTRGAPVK